MIPYVVEAVPACSKPSTGVSIRISPEERRDFGALVASSTKASQMLFARAKQDPAESPKLVQLIGLS